MQYEAINNPQHAGDLDLVAVCEKTFETSSHLACLSAKALDNSKQAATVVRMSKICGKPLRHRNLRPS